MLVQLRETAAAPESHGASKAESFTSPGVWRAPPPPPPRACLALPDTILGCAVSRHPPRMRRSSTFASFPSVPDAPSQEAGDTSRGEEGGPTLGAAEGTSRYDEGDEGDGGDGATSSMRASCLLSLASARAAPARDPPAPHRAASLLASRHRHLLPGAGGLTTRHATRATT